MSDPLAFLLLIPMFFAVVAVILLFKRAKNNSG